MDDKFNKMDDAFKQHQQKMDDAFQQQQQKMNNCFQQLFDKISVVELSTKTNSDTIALHSKELSNHSQRFDAMDAKFVSLENKIDMEIASVNSKLVALDNNLVAKLSISHTAPSIPSFASTPIAGSASVSSSASNTVINVSGTMTGSGSPNVYGGFSAGTSVVSHTASSATVTAGNVSTTTVPSATGLVTSPTAQVPATPGLHPINWLLLELTILECHHLLFYLIWMQHPLFRIQ